MFSVQITPATDQPDLNGVSLSANKLNWIWKIAQNLENAKLNFYRKANVKKADWFTNDKSGRKLEHLIDVRVYFWAENEQFMSLQRKICYFFKDFFFFFFFVVTAEPRLFDVYVLSVPRSC